MATTYARLWSEPPWGISTSPLEAAPRSPSLRQHALSRPAVAAGCSTSFQERRFPVAPRPMRAFHRIERPDYFPRWSRERLLGRASTNPDEPLSRHPASLGSTSCGWLVRTLSRLVRSVYRATSPVLEDVRRSFSVPDDRRIGEPCPSVVAYLDGRNHPSAGGEAQTVPAHSRRLRDGLRAKKLLELTA